ncbi:hypothetical protein CHUAL_007420 [Chamberlinius hualienensis]
MIRANIPNYYPVELEHGRSYTAYQIEFYHLGKLNRIKRRYRAFHLLHKQLKKEADLQTEFPPKRVRNWNTRVLEERRKGLEHYLQEALKLNPIPKLVLSFLGITIFHDEGVLQGDSAEQSFKRSHHPVVSFVGNSSMFQCGLTNMVVRGVMMGLYKTSCPQEYH